MARESDLYQPLKAFFEARGYAVKGEIGAADLVAVGPEGGDPIVVEMKLRFALALYLQAIERLRLTPLVFVAVPRPEGAQARRMLADNTAMCRRLGLGLLTVKGDLVEVHLEPEAPLPRPAKKRRARLLNEFARRLGDPNAGGATRHGLVTGYRQEALRCAGYLAEYGAARGAAVARDTGVRAATRIMADNHYGWFERVAVGVYALTEAGRRGLADWDGALPEG